MPTTINATRDCATSKRGDTRKRMLVSAAEVMCERGAAGLTIDAVLARSSAPRGSVYYHFPDGRNQILTEALRYAGDSITAAIDKAVDRGAMVLLREYVEFWTRLLSEGDPALLRKCQNPRCILYFYDTTKNHRRRWCSMAGCGNRAKVAAFYQRNRSGDDGDE